MTNPTTQAVTDAEVARFQVLREQGGTHYALEDFAQSRAQDAATVAVTFPPMYQADGVTSNPEWLAFKHGTLNPAMEAAKSSLGIKAGETAAQAAEGWAQWCEARGNNMLANFLRWLTATPAAGAGGSVGAVSDEQIAEIAERLELSDVHCTLWRNFATHILNVAALNRATPAPEQAATGSGQGVTDAERIDHLQMMAENGFVSMCFEMDGGFHVTLEGVADEPEAARNVDSIRAGIDWHLAKMHTAILSSASPAGEGEGEV